MEILQRVKTAGVEAVIVLPAWQSVQLSTALALAVDFPILIECNQALLVPPKAYGVHVPHKVPKHWWAHKQWHCLTGIRLSSDAERLRNIRSR